MWTEICSFDFSLLFCNFPWAFSPPQTQRSHQCFPYGQREDGASHPNYLKASIKGAVVVFFVVVVHVTDPEVGGGTWWDAEEQSFSSRRSAREHELELFILDVFEWTFLCRAFVAFGVLHFPNRATSAPVLWTTQ